MSDETNCRVIALRPEHRAQWECLYAGYAAFYKVEQTPQMRETVWNWIFDADNELEALVAVEESGAVVGIAHYRRLLRPLRAVVGGFLDDLFVEPSRRGGGVAQALMRGLAEVARARGWATIRWLTAEDNYRARGFYDQLSSRTVFLTYEMKI
jgi:ribosomal protein S18 acetylase RimI-like enzyme